MTPKVFVTFFAIGTSIAIIGAAAAYLGADTLPPRALEVPAKAGITGIDGPILAADPIRSAPASEPIAPRSQVHVSSATVSNRLPPSRLPQESTFPKQQFISHTDVSPVTDAHRPDEPRIQDVPLEQPAHRSPKLVQSGAVGLSSGNFGANTPNQEVPLPLIFQDVDPAEPGLNEGQAAVKKTLRDDFVRDVGGPNQNPHDPRYAKRWNDKLPIYDAQARLFFGAAYAEKAALEAYAK